MRQAGRYLPEYRRLRAKHPFLEMCHQPELIAQTTLLPFRTFDLDAAILFSDILILAEAYEIGLQFEEGIGPLIERPLSSAQDVERLPAPHIPEKLNFVAEGIRLLQPQLHVPLIGFCGGPFTVASYMIEGRSSRDLKKTKQWMLRDSASFHRLLAKIADSSIEYLKLQIAAGVDAIQIFDSWAHVLGHAQFEEFSLAYLERILRGISHTKIPVTLFCRGSSVFAPYMAKIAPSAISLDWQCDICEMRRAIPSRIALQGNLDPDILYADKTTIQKETDRILTSMQNEPGYIFNLGHGIHPDTPVDAVKILVERVKGT